jgi:ABC-type transport system substrate-binding protein
MLDRADATTDSAQRNGILAEAQRALREDAPCVPLFQLELLLGARRGMSYEPRLDATLALRTAGPRG